MVMEVVMKTNYYNVVFSAGYALESGDCDDGNPLISHFDLDDDGFSTCEGDCDDEDYWSSISFKN